MARPPAGRGASPGVLVAVVLLAIAAPAAADEVDYVLTPVAETGRLRVELTWSTAGRTQSALNIAPRWGTVPDVPALIRDLRVEGATVEQTSNTRWLLKHAPQAHIVCRYEVNPGRRDLTWEAMHYPVTTSTFFHGLGNAFLLVPQAGGGLPEQYDITLRWKLPERWKAVCSWGSGAHVGARLSPADLRNSVYLAGRLAVQTVKRGPRSVTVAMLDRFAFSADRLADLAATIITHECEFMGEQDFPPFLVTAVPVGEAVKTGDTHVAGMGLHQSFTLFAAPQSELNDAFEHLFAHELFHYWNGGLLKAQEPDKLVYWFTEGFTDYYSLRILYESGFWKPDVYAKWINRHLREYDRNPAQHATNEEIAAEYWQERDTIGEVPYQRGLLLGLRWHRQARDHGVPDGVDRLFKSLVDRGRRDSLELSNEIIRQAGISALGKWFADEFDAFVTQARRVEVPANALAPPLQGRVEAVYEFQLGFDRQRSLKDRRVRRLESGSAAQKAGLREGDELLGWKIGGEADEQVELQVRRGDDVKSIQYLPRGQRSDILQFRVAAPDAKKRP